MGPCLRRDDAEFDVRRNPVMKRGRLTA